MEILVVRPLQSALGDIDVLGMELYSKKLMTKQLANFTDGTGTKKRIENARAFFRIGPQTPRD